MDLKGLEDVFLDAGGVILDEASHEEARAALTVELLVRRGIPYSLEEYGKDLGESLAVHALHSYGYVFWKRTGGAEEYLSLYGEYLRAWEALELPLVPMAGLEDALAELSARYRLGILGQYGPELRRLLAERDLLKYFSHAATQEEFSITKPDPRYFELVLARAGAAPEASCMVGDRLDKDIVPAKMVGMRTVRMRSGIYASQEARNYEELPDAEAGSLEDLALIL